MVILIAGGSLSTGSHDPYCGTLMPLGPSTPSVGVKHESRTNWRFHSIIRRSAKQEYPEVAAGDIFIRKTANSDGLLEELGRLWRAAEGLHEPVWRDLARFLIAVPCRRSEAARLDWSHLDLAAAEWR